VNVAGNLEAGQHRLGRTAQIAKFEIFARFFRLQHFRGNFAENHAQSLMAQCGPVIGAEEGSPSVRTSNAALKDFGSLGQHWSTETIGGLPASNRDVARKADS
jgi:hypothetical protein